MTFLGILLAISAVLQGWKASNRRHGIKYAPAEAAQRQIRQDDEEQAKRESKVRFK